MNTYTQSTEQFAKQHNVKLKINNVEYKRHFDTDKESRYVFNCALSRNGKKYTFNFGQSIFKGSEEPEIYDILACLQKYEIGTFEDFCADFGYDNNSITAHKTYKAVLKEYQAVERLFGDILEELKEIQ